MTYMKKPYFYDWKKEIIYTEIPDSELHFANKKDLANFIDHEITEYFSPKNERVIRIWCSNEREILFEKWFNQVAYFFNYNDRESDIYENKLRMISKEYLVKPLYNPIHEV